MEHIDAFLANIVDQGGEGIILRDPEEPYRAGRSPGYLKHKVIHNLQDCIVYRTNSR